jgi:hypothetical protein
MSGGAYLASRIVFRFPDAFNGSIHIMGAAGLQRSSSTPVYAGQRKGRYYLVSDMAIQKLRRNRFAFIIGRQDPYGNYEAVINAYTSMQQLGFEVLLFDIPELGHECPRDIEIIVQALDYLDDIH